MEKVYNTKTKAYKIKVHLSSTDKADKSKIKLNDSVIKEMTKLQYFK